MSTKIFRVSYEADQLYNGKFGSTVSESKSVVAKDALDAILKTKKLVAKPFSYIDEETKKKVTVVGVVTEYTSVNLLASTD